MHITFRNDTTNDFFLIVREVAQWLTDDGQELWAVDTLIADNLIDEHTRGNCYVLYVGDIPAATFILQGQSLIYFPDVLPNTAGIIHKLAIRRAFAGRNLFQFILDFCKDDCLKRGIHEILLETDATRPALMRFYERNGFTPTYQKENHEFGQTFTCQYYVLRF